MSVQSGQDSPPVFRRLLPAQSSAQDQATQDQAARAQAQAQAHPPPPPPPPKEGSGRKRKHPAIPGACDQCRKQKAKCTGERPTCRRCARRRVACHYVTEPGETPSQALGRNFHDLQGQASALAELLALLRDLPEPEARNIYHRLRAGVDVHTILNHVKAGSILLQMAVSPEVRLRYELPYRPGMPEELLPDNPYLSSLVYEATALYISDHGPTSPSQQGLRSLGQHGAKESKSLYLTPFHAAEVVDTLLTDARPSEWTSICKDNMLMRGILRTFFRCEYQFTAAFHKDLFLEDMASGKTDFCSSLLVNVLLAYACTSYPAFKKRSEYWNPQTLTYRFFMEARRLWDLEAARACITNIQAGIIFSVFYNLSGLDELGQPYRIHAVALAHEMRLLDMAVEEKQGARMRNGKAFVAWAIYNWETLSAFSFNKPPLIKKPPTWRLPDPSRDVAFYGETWVKYPLGHSLLPCTFGHVFEARSRFRVIMNHFCEESFGGSRRLTIEKADELRSRLQEWYDSLSTPLLAKTIVLPGQMQLHIYYQHLLLSIYEPLLGIKDPLEPTPQQVVREARKHMQTLIRLYYLRHGFEAMDLFIVIPVMLAATQCLDDMKKARLAAAKMETIRSTLILAARWLSYQRRNHYLAQVLYTVVRSQMQENDLAVLRGLMPPEERVADERQELVQVVRSHWPVSVVKSQEDIDSHMLGNLVENYAHMNMASEDRNTSSNGMNMASVD